MGLQKIYDGNGGHYTIMRLDDVEFVNPVKFYEDAQITFETETMLGLLQLKFPKTPRYMLHMSALLRAAKAWNEFKKEIDGTAIPGSLLKLFETTKKRAQVNLLKGAQVKSNELLAFIFEAHRRGYTFSQYMAESLPNGTTYPELPKVYEVRDKRVEKIGSTKLSDAQLKQVVDHRKVTVSKFLDNGSEWFCFFITYESIGGKESWENGQPHYHFISDKFGMARERVVDELKSNNYSLNSLPHIALLDRAKP